MREPTLTHPDFLGGLDTFFDRTCTIQKTTPTRDAAGQPQDAWTDLASHVDLACRLAPVTARSRAARVQRDDMTVTTCSHVIIMAGPYPSVTTAHQAVVDSVSYQIVNVVRDSAQVATELEVEVVST